MSQEIWLHPCFLLNLHPILVKKSLSEALIFASTNPQYDDRLFIELHVQYMKIPSLNLGRTCSVKRRASDKDLVR